MSGRRRFLARAAGVLAALAGGRATAGLGVPALPAHEVAAPRGRGGDSWVGEIVTIPYSFAPRGFVFCEGQVLNIQNYQSLYALIGNNYGGDGRRTLALPDTRRLEADMAKRAGSPRPLFRYAIAVDGIFPSRA